MVYRLFCLQSHYRKPLEFSYEALDNAAAAYEKLIKRLRAVPEDGEVDKEKLEEYNSRFAQAVGNDMNTSMGLTVLFDLLKEDCSGATKREAVKSMDSVLSLQLARAWEQDGQTSGAGMSGADEELTAYVEQKIAERAAAKKEKDFARADAIRDELKERGVLIRDTREGVQWEMV